LFDVEYDDMPDFIGLYGHSWFEHFWSYIKTLGYDYQGLKHNRNQSPLVLDRFGLHTLVDHEGVGGYFYATVYSQLFYERDKGVYNVTHAVIVDRNCNIVHDPNPNNKPGMYPLCDEFNGVIHAYLINPKL
jgi:hypothetical protein